MKKLVGEGKPFHSALDKALELLPEKASPEQVVNHLLKMGVKPQELIDRRMDQAIGAPLIPRERTVKLKKPDNKGRTEIVEPFFETTSVKGAKAIPRSTVAELASKNPAPAIGEKVLGGDRSEPDSEAPYHGKWTLPGGENYREMLIKAPENVDNRENIMELEAKLRRAPPGIEREALYKQLNKVLSETKEPAPINKEQFEGVPTHFGGEPGILASMRLKDRIVPGDMGYTLVNMKSGNKSQHYNTEEEARAAMQSMPESMRPMLSIQHTRGPNKKLLHLEELQSDWHQQGREKGYKQNFKELPKDYQIEDVIDPTGKKIYYVNSSNGEMVGQSSNKEDAIQQALNNINKNPIPDAPFKKNWEEMALKRLIHHAAEKGYHGVVVTPGQEQADRYGLEKHVKKLHYNADIKRLRAFNHSGREVISQDATPQDLPKQLGQELAEKLLQQPQEFGVHTLEDQDVKVGGKGMKAFYDTKVPNILNSIGKKYGVKTELHGHKLVTKEGSGQPTYNFRGEPSGEVSYPEESKQLHYFPITEDMRKDVLTNGLPLYNKGGTVHMADGGDMDTMQLEMTNKKTKKPTVEQMKQAIFAKAQQGLMKPSEVLGKHEGKYLHMTEADRAKVEKRKHGMRGGVGFTQIGLEDPEYAGRTWGVGKASVAAKLLRRQRKGLTPEEQSIWTTFIGTPEMHTSNQLVFNRMWNKFQEAKKAGLLDPEQEAKMLEIMRSAMTKGTAKKPPKAIFEPDASFDNTHHLFDTFERRRILADLMSGKKVGGKKGQIFDASKMIEDTTDPRLLHAPTLSVGPHVFSFDDKISYEPHLNKAFPYMLHGETSPDAFTQLPFTVAAPDFAQQIRQSKGREPGYMDIVRGIPRQQLTEKYLTALQKQGYNRGGGVRMADGGQVDIQNIGVEEAPDMDVKQYFMPRPMTSNVFPVGGIQQAPMQPQQQPQVPQGQQGMPQGQAPFQPPQAPPRQPPSNILQMTPQGQAMSAMTPPKPMARGGHVDRDTMMLELMNRQAGRR